MNRLEQEFVDATPTFGSLLRHCLAALYEAVEDGYELTNDYFWYAEDQKVSLMGAAMYKVRGDNMDYLYMYQYPHPVEKRLQIMATLEGGYISPSIKKTWYVEIPSWIGKPFFVPKKSDPTYINTLDVTFLLILAEWADDENLNL